MNHLRGDLPCDQPRDRWPSLETIYHADPRDRYVPLRPFYGSLHPSMHGPSLPPFFLFSSVFSFLFSLSKTHLLLLHLVPSVLELSIVIDRGDNNDRILLSSKLFL